MAFGPCSIRTNSPPPPKAVLTKQKDLSLLASGESPKTDIYTITANTDLTNITAIRLEVLD